MNKKAYIYASISEYERRSIISQIRILQAYADEHGYEVVQIYKDKSTVWHYERPMMAECLSLLCPGDVLMLTDILFLGINYKCVMWAFDQLVKNKVDIYVADFGIHSLDKDGNLSEEMKKYLKLLNHTWLMHHYLDCYQIEKNSNITTKRTRSITPSHPKYDLIWKLLEKGFTQEYICYIAHSTIGVIQKVRKDMVEKTQE